MCFNCYVRYFNSIPGKFVAKGCKDRKLSSLIYCISSCDLSNSIFFFFDVHCLVLHNITISFNFWMLYLIVKREIPVIIWSSVWDQTPLFQKCTSVWHWELSLFMVTFKVWKKKFRSSNKQLKVKFRKSQKKVHKTTIKVKFIAFSIGFGAFILLNVKRICFKFDNSRGQFLS